eukprot:3434481-Pyramimonas_sp.AAC.2
MELPLVPEIAFLYFGFLALLDTSDGASVGGTLLRDEGTIGSLLWGRAGVAAGDFGADSFGLDEEVQEALSQPR